MTDGKLEQRNASVEAEVRRRLTEMSAAAGVPHSRASLEILYLLPDGFLNAYTALFDAALKLPSSPQGGTGRAGDLGKANSGDALPGTHKGLRVNSGAEGGGSAPHLGGGATKKGPGGWAVKDPRALEVKTRIDKRLRSIAREIRQELAGAEAGGEEGGKGGGKKGAAGETGGGTALSCSGCGRIAQREWNWCPHCGGRFTK